MPLHATDLLPALRPASWLDGRGLSDDGFRDTLASIALSRDLYATFTCGGADVSYRGLGELDLSAHRAWDRAADNLIARAHTAEGVCVRTRPASALLGPRTPGLQVAPHGSPASSWLAHPHSFTLLDDHLTRLLGEPVVWLPLTATTLVAVPDGDVDKQAFDLRSALAPTPVHLRNGFPSAVSSRTPVAAPA